jgi:hydrogenase expression/formation protein HypE
MMNDTDRILLAHGSGGQLSHDLIDQLFLRYLDHPVLAQLGDAAVMELTGSSGPPDAEPIRLALTTDSYVVSPLFFPGGDIGKLAVCGTVNDLAVSGAAPLFLSAGFILEEGLPLDELERVVASLAATARAAGTPVVTGDTKVVERGQADRLFINTAGVGLAPGGVELGSHRVQPGDVILLNGAIGDHGMTIMSQREGLSFSSPLVSDCAPLNGLIAAMWAALAAAGTEAAGLRALHWMRDPTRGGLATTLNELAIQSGLGIEVIESAIPVHEAVRAACEMLGLDPLHVANEGKLVACVAPQAADAVLAAMRAHEYGGEAAAIGQVMATHAGHVVLRTPFGARRVLSMLVGEHLPRIC